MRFYDAHIHFLFDHPADDLGATFDYFEKIGLAGFVAIVFVEYPPDMETIQKLNPEGYHEDVNLEILADQKDPFPLFKRSTSLEIIPYLDARFIETNIEHKIRIYKAQGFKGLKLFYVPEEDSALRIGGMQKAFGRTPKESERITLQLIDCASAQDLSILIHVDLRRYGGFISEIIRGYPNTNFNIAHFGFSRRALAPLIEKNNNCYTDLSSLTPIMRQEPRIYREFVKRYQDKILFGSDALIGRPEIVQETTRFVSDLIDDQALSTKTFYKNYLDFHKRREESQ